MTTPTPAPVPQVAISRIGTETLAIPIVGTAPLIVHRFSEKAKRQMLDNMQGRKTPKERKDPEAEYDSAFYRNDDGAYRPEFTEWTTNVEVTYVKSMLTRESVLSLIEAGGMGVGIGEWRPEKKGDFGTYTIDDTREVEVLTA